MKECTETDKPLVSIVMATYNPRMDWLREQLVSLNDQSYENIELLILDDCSSKVPFEEIRKSAEDCITRFPLEIYQNERNLRSTKTFEKLTTLARGSYIAYCDQDDVWHRDKVEACLKALEDTSGAMAFSDMVIIDEHGEKKAESITQVRKHHKFHTGEGLAEILLFSNFVTGCTVLMKTDIAKAAIPFCPYMVHDHWLALYCAVDEKLTFIDKPLIDYRIHGSNQTLMMAGVIDKDSYLKIRIEEALKKFLWLRNRFHDNKILLPTIVKVIQWMKARKIHFISISKGGMTVWRYRKFCYFTSIFELFAPILPESIFMFIIGLKKKNIV